MAISRKIWGTWLRCYRRMGGSVGRLLIFLILAAAIGASVCLSQTPSSSSTSDGDTIRGTVVNAVTRAPIARALVHSNDDRFAALTDGEGHFEFSLPKPESAEGAVTPGQPGPGLATETQSRQIFLMAHRPGFLEGNHMPESVVEANPGAELTIALTPEALIKGRVSMSNGDTASGIMVQIFSEQIRDGRKHWAQMGVRPASSSGEFRFADLPAGNYKLFTNEYMDNFPGEAGQNRQRYGFPPAYFPGAVDFSSAQTIALAEGATFEADLSITHQPYYPVRIPVMNDYEGGMQVNVLLQGHRGPGYSLGYNPQTHRIEGMLPNGNYTVEAQTFGMNTGTGSVNIHVAGAAAEGPELAMVGNGSVTFNIREEFSNKKGNTTVYTGLGGRHGGALRYLQPVLEPDDDFSTLRPGAIQPPKSPDDNTVTIANLSPGQYWLRNYAQRGYVASAMAGTTDLLRQPLVVAAGANITVEVTMRDDFAELGGTVTGIANEGALSPGAANNVWVYCIPMADSPGQFQQITAPRDGSFDSVPLAPGTYRVLAFGKPQENIPYFDAEAMRAYESKGPLIQLSAGQKANVQVPMVSGTE